MKEPNRYTYDMIRALKLAFLFALVLHNIYAQEIKSQLHSFLGTEFIKGTHSFNLMVNELTDPKSDVKIIYDENGKILNPKIDITPDENRPTTQFVAINDLMLHLEYSDSLFIIRPMENTFCPYIKIEIKTSRAYIDNEVLESMTEIVIDNKKNVFNSAWKGYQWTSKSSEQSSQISPRLTLGIINESGQYYIEILWFVNGKSRHYRLLG